MTAPFVFRRKENAINKRKKANWDNDPKQEEKLFDMAIDISYCSLVPRSSNDSQTHFKFCFAKGVCSLLNQFLTQQNS